MPNTPLLRAYVDETGDRGTSASSSPFFAMAGVVVAVEDEPALRQTVRQLRADLKVPATKPMHWREHVKTFERRQHVAACLVRHPIVVNYVVFEKAAIPQNAYLRRDQMVFYNYAAKLMLQRLLLTAEAWPSGPGRLTATFGHVRGFDHANTRAYLRTIAARERWRPYWQLLDGIVQWADSRTYDGLQVADQYAGMLSVALRADQFGGFDPHHLLAVRHQIRRDGGRSWGAGFKVLAQRDAMESYPWWPSTGL